MNNIKFYEFIHQNNTSWKCRGVCKLDGENYTSFESVIKKANVPVEVNEGNIYVYGSENDLYQIQTTLCVDVNYDINNDGLKINIYNYGMPETVYTTLIGSIITQL